MTETVDRVGLRQRLSPGSTVAPVVVSSSGFLPQKHKQRLRSCTKILSPKSCIASEFGVLGLPVGTARDAQKDG